jgi:hypothetical protein
MAKWHVFFLLFVLALAELASAKTYCHYCAKPNTKKPVGPTYVCGKAAGYKNYNGGNIFHPLNHCWWSQKKRNSKFNNCCKRSGKVPKSGVCPRGNASCKY